MGKVRNRPLNWIFQLGRRVNMPIKVHKNYIRKTEFDEHVWVYEH